MSYSEIRKKYTGAYNSYSAAMSRCYNKKDPHYKGYGERGITMCEEWKGNPNAFVEWALKTGWKNGLTIERINVNEGYNPDNCCWIPKELQCRNKRNSNLITYNGETKCFGEWCTFFGIPYNKAKARERYGWSFEEIMEIIPKLNKYKKRGKHE